MLKLEELLVMEEGKEKVNFSKTLLEAAKRYERTKILELEDLILAAFHWGRWSTFNDLSMWCFKPLKERKKKKTKQRRLSGV